MLTALFPLLHASSSAAVQARALRRQTLFVLILVALLHAALLLALVGQPPEAPIIAPTLQSISVELLPEPSDSGSSAAAPSKAAAPAPQKNPLPPAAPPEPPKAPSPQAAPVLAPQGASPKSQSQQALPATPPAQPIAERPAATATPPAPAAAPPTTSANGTSSATPTATTTGSGSKPAAGSVSGTASVRRGTCQTPPYPPMSMRFGESGVVTLRFLISENGQVLSSHVEKSSGYKRLDEAALAALSLCQFKPATQAGKPVQGWATQSYRWDLDSNSEAF